MTLLRPIKPFSPENFVSCNKRLNQGSSTCFLPSVPLKTVRLERVKPLFVRQGWFKFKKKRSERQRVHLSEWKEDLMAYISEKSDVYKPYLVTTKKEIREALGIPERTLDKLLKVLKANQEIFFKIKPGRNGGIQLASVKSLLLSIIKVKKEEKESYIKALSEFFDLEHTFIQETLNKLAERPKTDTQLDLFSYDTG